MDKKHRFPHINGTSNIHVIKSLEALLRRAKHGSMVSLVFMFEDTEHGISSGAAGRAYQQPLKAAGMFLKGANGAADQHN